MPAEKTVRKRKVTEKASVVRKRDVKVSESHAASAQFNSVKFGKVDRQVVSFLMQAHPKAKLLTR
jgi:hypothetical protein